MARYQRPVINFNADDVWAAACAAQRMNGSYVKYRDPADTNALHTNRELVQSFLEAPLNITQEDRDQAEKVRAYYKAFTFKILKGIKLNEFENNAMVVANRDNIESNYDLAIIASLPSSYERGIARDTIESRINFAKGGLIGKPSQKVKLEVEVLRSVFSQQWNCNFITAITKDDQPVFFSYRDRFDSGTFLTIAGTIKAHRENITQLNRVKVL